MQDLSLDMKTQWIESETAKKGVYVTQLIFLIRFVTMRSHHLITVSNLI